MKRSRPSAALLILSGTAAALESSLRCRAFMLKPIPKVPIFAPHVSESSFSPCLSSRHDVMGILRSGRLTEIIGVAAHEKSRYASENQGVWIDANDLTDVFNTTERNDQEERYRDMFVDVTDYSGAHCTTSRADNSLRVRPTHLRFRPEARNTACAAPCFFSEPFLEHKSIAQGDQKVQFANGAAETTLRWCDDFVVRLGLCPWAKLSLTTQNAVRIKVVPQELGMNVFEGVIRDAAKELLRVTQQEGYEYKENDCADDKVDPNVAITFVVAPPPLAATDMNDDQATPAESSDLDTFEFVPFHDFFVDLEDRLFEESLEYEEATADMGLISDANPRIGDLVTIAPFHPRWQFAVMQDDNNEEDSVAWEKRAPYPTVSLVLTSAIRAAGEKVTEKIGIHNEEVLNDLGSHALKEMFRERVWQKKRKQS